MSLWMTIDKPGRPTRQQHLEDLANHIDQGGNIGLVLPPESVALDLDSPEQMAAGKAMLPAAPVQTSSKGHGHAIAQFDPHGEKIPGHIYVGGIATLTRVAGRAQIVVAPSTHYTGARYEWISPLPADPNGLPMLPIIRRAPGQATKRQRPDGRPVDGTTVDYRRDYIDTGQKVPHGSRRHFVTWAAASSAATAVDLAAEGIAISIEKEVRDLFRAHCVDPDHVKDDTQFGTIVRWAIDAEHSSRSQLDALNQQQHQPFADAPPTHPLWTDLASTGDGKPPRPISTTNNLRALLEFEGVRCRLNDMTDRVEVHFDDRPYDDFDSAVELIRDAAARHGLPGHRVPGQIGTICYEERYHPVRDWIESRRWDGHDRFADVAGQLVLAAGSSLAGTLLRDLLVTKWLVSVAAALYPPETYGGCEGVLTLQGPQGSGKTTFFRRLIPSIPHAVTDGLHLDPSDKDSRIAATSATIVELGELDSSLARHLDRLKAFLTLDEDHNRAPYARAARTRPRQTVFGATVNSAEFLRERENRRFWVVPIREVRHAEIDMQQVFAQARAEVDQGGSWWLEPRERDLLTDLQVSHRAACPIADRLSGAFVDGAEPSRWVSVTDLLIEVGVFQPGRRETVRAGIALDEMGFTAKKRTGAKRLRFVPLIRVRSDYM